MKKIKVGITMGDPSGIGPAVLVKAVQKLKGMAEFIIIGDGLVLKRVENALGIRLLGYPNIRVVNLRNILNKDFSFGKIKAEYGKASIEYLDKAVELIRKKQINCMVNCPISKEAIKLAGFRFPGHTEYLAHVTNSKNFAMMLMNNKLKFSLLTTHLALKDVSSKINKHIIGKNILLTVTSLRKIFGIKKPRIVVCGLNPHASDNGVIGREENNIIIPALKALRKTNKAIIDGPISSDVAISKASIGKYDAVIAMYHDQALIPLKLAKYDTAANITLGLPFIRTSPLHGTAFDIAKDHSKANPESLITAIKLAIKCTLNLKKA